MIYLVNTVHVNDDAPEDCMPYAYIVEAEIPELAVEKVKAQLVQEELDLLEDDEIDEINRLKEHGFEAISYNDIGSSGEGFIIIEPIELDYVVKL